MSHELVVEGKAFVNDSFQQCCIGIDDGKITAIKKILTGDRRVRFSKELLLPAGIDVHVHFRDPGLLQKESFYTGSVAAAFGGISCVFDMPNTLPACITKQTLLEKQRIGNQKSIVDFGVYAGITKKLIEDVEYSNQLGSECHGFKLFLGDTTNSFNFPDALLNQVLSILKRLQKPVFIHAEDNHCLQKNKKIEQKLSDHHTARPSQCEIKAITNVLSALQQVETPVHFCHVSAKDSINILQQKPDYVSYGITPHHSLLNINYDHVPMSWLKMNPPLRPMKDQQIVYHSLQQGNVFLLESDHAPHTEKEKNTEFTDAPCGVPGVETMYPLFLAQVVKKQLSFSRLISLLCYHPAELLSLSKGKIAIDYDADIITVDRRNIQKISSETLHSKAGWTPFVGFPAVFPSTVFIRGTKVIDSYEQNISAGYGTLVPFG